MKRCTLLILFFGLFVIVETTMASVTCRKNIVALTFDDGPNPPHTEELLKLLEKHKIKATFFLIGRNIEMHKFSALEIVKSGHEVGNHGYMHERRASLFSLHKIVYEIRKTDELIESLGLAKPKLFRPPFGESYLGGLVSKKLGKTLILYDKGLAPKDYLRVDPELIYEDIIKNVKPCSIIALHDGEGIRVETLVSTEKIINELKSRNYDFVTVSNLLRQLE